MTAFDYTGSAGSDHDAEAALALGPIRSDLAEAYRAAWLHISSPGTWLTGAERVAVAEETRRARSCALCRERKASLSPHAPRAVDGEHDHAGILTAPMVDEVHRITTDAARLTEAWFRSLVNDGLAPEKYVEALGVAVITISIDAFQDALGLSLEPLPRPIDGRPTRIRPTGVVTGESWVPMLSSRDTVRELGLPTPIAPFVIRALSLVPEEVRAWQRVSAAQYLTPEQITSLADVPGRATSRSQIELVAARVSALNECFY